MHVRDLMSTPVITCQSNDTLETAARLMWEHDIGALAVVRDDGKLAGVITDRDTCMATYTRGLAPSALLVAGAMGRPPITVTPDTAVRLVEELMAANKIRRIPVVDADNRPIGMITLNDLAREAALPQSRLKHGHARITETLAAICQPRAGARAA